MVQLSYTRFLNSDNTELRLNLRIPNTLACENTGELTVNLLILHTSTTHLWAIISL